MHKHSNNQNKINQQVKLTKYEKKKEPKPYWAKIKQSLIKGKCALYKANKRELLNLSDENCDKKKKSKWRK